jgi:hypothetical protein
LGIAFRHFLQTLWPKRLTWAIVCLVIATAVVALFTRVYVQRLQSEANQAKSLSEERERRYQNERESAAAQQAERERALESKLKEEEARRARAERELSQQMRPQSVLAFTLKSLRGDPPVNQISLPRAPSLVVFRISLEGEEGFEKYLLTIFDHRRKPVASRGPLMPDQAGYLSIVSDSRSLRPGRYSLLVRGVTKEGESQDFGNYPFLVTKAR